MDQLWRKWLAQRGLGTFWSTENGHASGDCHSGDLVCWKAHSRCDVTKRFAKAGYVAFSPDLYSRNSERQEVLIDERIQEVKQFLEVVLYRLGKWRGAAKISCKLSWGQATTNLRNNGNLFRRARSKKSYWIIDWNLQLTRATSYQWKVRRFSWFLFKWCPFASPCHTRCSA